MKLKLTNFKDGILCFNSKYEEIKIINKFNFFSLFFLTYKNIIFNCLIITFFFLLFISNSFILCFFYSSFLSLFYYEIIFYYNNYFKIKNKNQIINETDSETVHGLKFSLLQDEVTMSNINIANCQLHIRKVKLLNDGNASFRITITHKTLRWHVWRFIFTFSSSSLHFSTLLFHCFI